MEDLKELKNKIEGIEITYNYDECYGELYNACIDYMNDTQNFDLDYLFEEFISYNEAEERAKYELETGGLERLYYFLGDTDLPNNILFKINAYGNLENISKEDLETLKEDILNNIDEKNILKMCKSYNYLENGEIYEEEEE